MFSMRSMAVGLWLVAACSRDSGAMQPSLANAGAAGEADRSGPESGGHAPVAAECIGRRTGEPFCVDTAIHVCTDSGSSMLEACGERRRCVERDRGAQCLCVPGAVEQGGDCVVAAPSCALAGGGCDPLTVCSMVAGKPVCGACPAGYGGDGVRGCSPQLQSLSLEQANLEPAFSPETTRYHARMPASGEHAVLHVSASQGARIAIDGQELPADGTWTSPLLSRAARVVEITVISPAGIATSYELTIERPAM